VIGTPRPAAASAPDRAARRRAQLRAVATAIADEARPARRFQVGDGVELRGTARRRQRVAPPVPEPARAAADPGVRPGALLVLAAEMALLVLLLAWPALRVATVSVTGTRLLSAGQVLDAARVADVSVFDLNGDQVAARVEALPWVSTASVDIALPNRVTIAVTERSPIALLVRGGTAYALAADGATQALTSAAQRSQMKGMPALVDLRPAALRTPVTSALVGALIGAAQQVSSALGVRMVAAEWDQSGQVSLWAASGWRAVLGDLSVPGALAAVPGQVAALVALKGTLDFADPAHPTSGPAFGYVELEDPATPAVGGVPGLPAAITAAVPGG
jgi:hypothetical protein